MAQKMLTLEELERNRGKFFILAITEFPTQPLLYFCVVYISLNATEANFLWSGRSLNNITELSSH